MSKPKYPTGLEFIIQSLENCRYKWTFSNCDNCPKNNNCRVCGKLSGGHQGYLQIGDRVKIKRMGEFKQKDKYILELLDRENEVSDFLSEQVLDTMIGNQKISNDTSNKTSYIPNYPQDFYDFSNGVDIPDGKVQEWIKQCIDALNKNESSNSHSISSGNTKVIVFRLHEGYEVTVAKGYKEFEYFNEKE